MAPDHCGDPANRSPSITRSILLLQTAVALDGSMVFRVIGHKISPAL
jgi:hypothetical protein